MILSKTCHELHRISDEMDLIKHSCSLVQRHKLCYKLECRYHSESPFQCFQCSQVKHLYWTEGNECNVTLCITPKLAVAVNLAQLVALASHSKLSLQDKKRKVIQSFSYSLFLNLQAGFHSTKDCFQTRKQLQKARRLTIFPLYTSLPFISPDFWLVIVTLPDTGDLSERRRTTAQYAAHQLSGRN